MYSGQLKNAHLFALSKKQLLMSQGVDRLEFVGSGVGMSVGLGV